MGLLEDVAGKYGKDSNWNALRGRTDDPLLQQLTSQYGSFAAGSDGMPNWNALRGMVSASPQRAQQPAAGSGYGPGYGGNPAPNTSNLATTPQAADAQRAASTSTTQGAPASVGATGAGVSGAANITPSSVNSGGGGAGTGGGANIANSLVAMQNASPMPATMPVDGPGAMRAGLGDRNPPQYGSALASLLRARTYGTIVG